MARILSGFLVVLLGCGSDEGGGGAGAPVVLTHEFPSYDIATGEEVSDVCQSWTLHNEEAVWVTAVRMENDGGWHHSNWFFVPENTYAAADGTDGDGSWPCDEREFDQVSAAVAGGVFYAQSTQTTNEEQRFANGAALRIPPRSRIVGSTHVLNFGEALTTRLRFEVDTIPEEDVVVRMAALNMSYFALDLPPRQRSEFAMECDYDAISMRQLGRPLDFKIYYVLPHYHTLAEGLRLSVVGGPNDGRTIFSTGADIGDPLGRTYDEPFDLAGATGIRMACTYDNPRDERVRYAIGDQEMCDVLVYTDSPLIIGGWSRENTAAGDDADGVALNDGNCEILAFRD